MRLYEITDEDLKQAELNGEIGSHEYEFKYKPDKRNTGPIVKRYYHGTTLKSAKNILKNGLKVSYTNDRGEFCKGFIFLDDRIGVARSFAPGGVYGPKKGVGVILEINPPPQIAKRIRWDLGEFLRCPVDIPPQYIRPVEITNKNIKYREKEYLP